MQKDENSQNSIQYIYSDGTVHDEFSPEVVYVLTKNEPWVSNAINMCLHYCLTDNRIEIFGDLVNYAITLLNMDIEYSEGVGGLKHPIKRNTIPVVEKASSDDLHAIRKLLWFSMNPDGACD